MNRDIVTIGTSGGGIEALGALLGPLPPDLAAAIFVVIHRHEKGSDGLARVLGRVSALPVRAAEHGAPVERGVVVVAPADRHLLLADGHVELSHGPRENNCRPAVDPLFRSAARAYGPRVIGVVLTGALDDGTGGLFAIKRRGGLTVVQDPATAAFAGMPTSARDNVAVDHVVSLRDMPDLIARLTREELAAPDGPPGRGEEEIDLDPQTARSGPGAAEAELDALGEPSSLTCPECHGALWELTREQPLRFRCRVGHAFTASILEEQHVAEREAALWAAVRNLHENARLCERMAERFRKRNNERNAQHFADKALLAQRQAAVLRAMLADD
ncbi:MAG TPA: chemotaxis protein CheB [Polyangia bacterium]|nr:chemotaxis protein CheB [Polyangia bacterium]